MKIDIDLKAGFLQSLKREVLATLGPEERAVIHQHRRGTFKSTSRLGDRACQQYLNEVAQ